MGRKVRLAIRTELNSRDTVEKRRADNESEEMPFGDHRNTAENASSATGIQQRVGKYAEEETGYPCMRDIGVLGLARGPAKLRQRPVSEVVPAPGGVPPHDVRPGSSKRRFARRNHPAHSRHAFTLDRRWSVRPGCKWAQRRQLHRRG